MTQLADPSAAVGVLPSPVVASGHDLDASAAGSATTISIVSHRQRDLVEALIADLIRVRPAGLVRVILTLNVPEDAPPSVQRAPFEVLVLRNERARGFGANHNRAFRYCATPWFAILNPDLRVDTDILMSALRDPEIDDALLAPRILEASGAVADASRRLLTPWQFLRRLSGRREVSLGQEVDWLAGVCLIARSSAFAAVGGFDERFYLYLEDADLCLRLQLAGWRIGQVDSAAVVHLAQRASRRSFRHLRWHVVSLFRHWLSAVFWRYLLARRRLRSR